MALFVIECACGHDITVEGKDRADATEKAKERMDESGIDEHFARYHPGEPVPDVEEMHAHIDTDLAAVS